MPSGSKVKRRCDRCGVTYAAFVVRLESGQGRYCSRTCSNVARAMDERARFWTKVDRRAQDACWPWNGAVDTAGYGAFKVDGKKMASHTVAFELAKGRTPRGKLVAHTCRNRLYCNPAHLVPGTRQTVSEEIDRRGTRNISRGERNANAKLTANRVEALRLAYLRGKVSATELARRAGISRRSMTAILRGETWSHIPFPDGYDLRYREVADARRRRTDA